MSKEILVKYFCKKTQPLFIKDNSWIIKFYYDEENNPNPNSTFDYVIYHYYCKSCQSLKKVKVYKYEIPIYEKSKYKCELCKNEKFIIVGNRYYSTENNSFLKEFRSNNILLDLHNIDIMKIRYKISSDQYNFILTPYTFIPLIDGKEIKSLLYEYEEIILSKKLYKEELFKKELIDDIKNFYTYGDVDKEIIIEVFIKNYSYDSINFYTKINKYSYLPYQKRYLFESYLKYKFNDFNFLLIDDIIKTEYQNIEDYFDFIRNYCNDKLLKYQFEKQFQEKIKYEEYDPKADFIIFRAFHCKECIKNLISNKNKYEVFGWFFFITLEYKEKHIPIIELVKLFNDIYSEKVVCNYLLEEDIDNVIEVLNIGSNLLLFINKSTLSNLLMEQNNIFLLHDELKKINLMMSYQINL